MKTGIDGELSWRGANGVFHPNVGWLYGDLLTSNIGLLDNTVATQYQVQQEFILYSPFVPVGGQSVHSIKLDITPGHQVNDDEVTVAVSATYDGVTHSQEYWDLYGEHQIYDNRLIVRRMGYVKDYVGYRFRLVTPERTAFSALVMNYGS